MKAQWQLVDIETGRAIKVEDEFELTDFCKSYFNDQFIMSYEEASFIFGEIDTHPTHLPNKPLLRIDEVAGYIDVSPRTVRNWIKNNQVRYIKVGGTYRIYRDSVVERKKGDTVEDKA